MPFCRRRIESMDSSRDGLDSHNHVLGLSQLLWRLPDLLHVGTGHLAVDGILGRLRPTMRDLLPIYILRPSIGRWTVHPGLRHRIHIPAPRYLYELVMYQILANLTGSRNLHRCREWHNVLPSDGLGHDLLQQETWNRGCHPHHRQLSWRSHIPNHGS
jgi:hypothetical protein